MVYAAICRINEDDDKIGKHGMLKPDRSWHACRRTETLKHLEPWGGRHFEIVYQKGPRPSCPPDTQSSCKRWLVLDGVMNSSLCAVFPEIFKGCCSQCHDHAQAAFIYCVIGRFEIGNVRSFDSMAIIEFNTEKLLAATTSARDNSNIMSI